MSMKMLRSEEEAAAFIGQRKLTAEFVGKVITDVAEELGFEAADAEFPHAICILLGSDEYAEIISHSYGDDAYVGVNNQA